jgi:8-oxo-dGTP pyrophosphatase MutT (NUDIX family)
MPNVQVAVKGLVESRGKFLILKQKVKGKEFFDVPGGRIGFRENLVEGLKREIKEETNLTVEVLAPLGEWHFIRELDNEKDQVTCFTFHCKVKGKTKVNTKKNKDKDEIVSFARWFAKKDLKKLNIKNESLKRLLKEFSQK